MLGTTYTFGHVWGIPLQVRLSWLITAGLVTGSLATGYFPFEYPDWDTALYWIAGTFTSILFFGSVLLHELGHAWTALREDVPVENITLFVLGGVAQISHEPETPRAEFRIVIAGPLTSLLLAVIFYITYRYIPLHPMLDSISLYLSRVNLVLSIFNMIPGFPLDGGRILRALLWKVKGDFRKATLWATTISFGAALSFLVLGVVIMMYGDFVGGLWVVFVGGYLGFVARVARQQVEEDAWRAEHSNGIAALPAQRYVLLVQSLNGVPRRIISLIRVQEETPRLLFVPRGVNSGLIFGQRYADDDYKYS